MSNRSLPLTVFAALSIGALPLAAVAQIDTSYQPPKLLSRGTNTNAVVGAGSVKIKIFVHKSGKADAATKVSSSTNPGDNAAALEIAASSKYTPGTRAGKPVDAYYTFVLKFAGADGGASVGDDSSNATLRKVAALERTGNYALAKTELADYLKTSPSDKDANLLLAVASAFTDDAPTAAAAFDKSGTIPDKYRTLAARAYTNAAAAASRNNMPDVAAGYATKSIAITPSADSYNIRGMSEYVQKKYDTAVPDLEKAHELAISQKATPKNIAIIGTNLAAAYSAAGETDKATAAAKDVLAIDPNNSVIQDVLANAYSDRADVLVKAGKRADAVAQLEAGAVALPARSAALYSSAAVVLSNDTKVDWKRVKAEADKALAADPADGLGNYLTGIALANQNDRPGALAFFTKAQSSPKAATDADFQKRVAQAIKDTTPAK